MVQAWTVIEIICIIVPWSKLKLSLFGLDTFEQEIKQYIFKYILIEVLKLNCNGDYIFVTN